MSDVNASLPAAETDEPADAPPKRGFQIGKRFYPMTIARKLGDPALVNDIAGMSWDTFQLGLGYADPDGDDDEAVPDPAAVMAGLVAIAVKRGNPNWPRHKVVAYVEALDSSDVEMVGFTPAAAKESGVPPTGTPTTASGDPTPGETPEPSPETQGSP